MRWALNWLVEPLERGDETERLRGRLLMRLLVVLLPLTCVMGAASALVRVERLEPLEAAVGGVLFGLGLTSWCLARIGRSGLGGAVIALTAIAGGVCVAFLEDDPVRAIASALFGMTGVVYASFLFKARRAAIFAAIGVIALPVLLLHPSLTDSRLVLPVFLTFFLGSLLVVGAAARERQLALVRLGEERLRATFDAALDAMLVVDADGIVRDANRPALELFCPAGAVVPGFEHNPELARRLSTLVQTACPDRFEMDVVADGGRTLPAEVSVVPVALDGGRGLCVFVRDLTDRRRYEVELLRNDRLVSVGRLAAGVAHEINNPLSYVVTNLQVVDATLDGSRHDLHEMIDDALDGAGRVRDIVADLTAFSRGKEEPPTAVAVSSVVDVVVQLAAGPLRHGARLERALEGAPPVLAAPGRLSQVLLNLVLNAVQSRPPSRSSPVLVRIEAAASGDDAVEIRVRDDGPGIPSHALPQLFVPFFTTKGVGEGTGLGLYLSRDILRAMGGELSLEETSAAGSTFLVRLPRAVEGSSLLAVEAAPEILFPAELRVLLVDDDAGVARAVERCLPEHAVRWFPAAEDALQSLADGTRFDVALLDVMMPGMSGTTLARQLVADGWAPRRILLVTGGALSEDAAGALASGEFRVVSKPVDRATLRAAVLAAIDSPGPAMGVA